MRSLLLFAAIALIAAAAAAQSTLEVNGGLQLHLSTPGARALAMGGAVLAVGQGAAAAVINPAGLSALERPEVSLELRESESINEFSVAGSVRFDQGRRDTSDLITGSSQIALDGFQYLSFVYPSDTWAVALFRHELADYRSEFVAFGPSLVVDGTRVANTLSAQGELGLSVDRLGVAFSYRVTNEFSLGAAVSFDDVRLQANTARFIEDAPFPQDIFSPGREADVQTLDGDDTDTTFTLGFLWTEEKWSIGGSYRQGAEVEATADNRVGRAFPDRAGNLIGSHVGDFKVPDVYGVGIAFRPVREVVIGLQWDRVGYSDLTASVVDPFGFDPRLIAGLEIGNVDELRLGFEWGIFGRSAFPAWLRAGIWNEEGHRISFEGDPGLLDANSAHLGTAFIREDDDELHWSIGVGIGIGRNVQLDAAADFSDIGDTIAVAGLYRFGR